MLYFSPEFGKFDVESFKSGNKKLSIFIMGLKPGNCRITILEHCQELNYLYFSNHINEER